MGEELDIVYECASSFENLLECEYHLVITKNKKQVELKLDFKNSDFFHLSGFQYFGDIAIPRDKKKTIELCKKGKISLSLLNKSSKFTDDLKKRIDELRFLEQYLDTNNYIRLFSASHTGSRINAEYFIESKIPGRENTVYIFLKERTPESGRYCVESFFVKSTKTYRGTNCYWMLKEKWTETSHVCLYRHPNYK